ncbi:DUF4168 domain-containing protein [Nodosilinea sp. LEGE 06152]|uniref:DUF4168 domain-containing protein n=1 Tax=Nodosilinea sp. LEGE 06152 TaxID=2777966 RepID=UPI00187FAC6A|nr:DUF4168 domain-containing protein [Nodosilinea sp. LEGE 06152]MBE9155526.1 DUF4168 domain-containing protein [Nodosilinea sp. LEGE 06152]
MSTTTIGDLVSARLLERVSGIAVMDDWYRTTAIDGPLSSVKRVSRLLARWMSGLVGLSLIALLGLGLPAIAAPAVPTADAAPLATPAAPDASDIPSETVSRFVRAYIAVVRLIESRELSLQRTETDTESRQMQQEIQAAALDLIQANGLTLSAYWELLGLANSDPEFRDRVLAQIDEAEP